MPALGGGGQHGGDGVPQLGGRGVRAARRYTLIEAAKAAARTKDTYLAAKYRHMARRGPNKATVAVIHAIIAVWLILTTGETYQDLGPDHFQKRRDPERQAQRLVRELADLGYQSTAA